MYSIVQEHAEPLVHGCTVATVQCTVDGTELESEQILKVIALLLIV